MVNAILCEHELNRLLKKEILMMHWLGKQAVTDSSYQHSCFCHHIYTRVYSTAPDYPTRQQVVDILLSVMVHNAENSFSVS